MSATDHIEFSRLITVEGITIDRERTEDIQATADECVDLAKRFDIRSLSNFKTTIKIRRIAGGKTIMLEGAFSADLVQACVVSLQDVPAHIDGTFECFFSEDAQTYGDEIEISLEDDNAPELIENGVIDLGEVAAQYLALDIDLYPRAPGVSLAAQLAGTGATAKSNPFQVLEALKDKDKTKK